MTDRELLQMALDALENAHANEPIWKTPIKEAIEALRARLAQHEPVATGFIRTLVKINDDGVETWKNEPFYTAPPQPEPMIDGWPLYSGLPPVKVQDERETQYKSWAQSAQVIGGQYDPRRELVGLTNEEKKVICQEAANEDWTDLDVINATEAKLREKNG